VCWRLQRRARRKAVGEGRIAAACAVRAAFTAFFGNDFCLNRLCCVQFL
jgi:hypothetical protein